jgi:hypothetical protein
MNIKIENLLSELERIKHLISQYENITQMPVIERDILLAAVRDLYSDLQQIPGGKPEIHIQTDVPAGKSVPTESASKGTERVEFIEDDIPSKPKKTEKLLTTDTHSKKEAIQTRKTEEKKKVKPETIGDKLQGERQFVYETLAEKAAQQNISSKLQSKPISNINSAIGINDKFKLMRDLFNEDTESYTKTINKLDTCNNFNEAFTYISTNFNWDMEDDSVQFILDLVRRKFIVDKDE